MIEPNDILKKYVELDEFGKDQLLCISIIEAMEEYAQIKMKSVEDKFYSDLKETLKENQKD